MTWSLRVATALLTAALLAACTPSPPPSGGGTVLTCPNAPEHEVWTDYGVTPGPGAGTAQILASSYGMLASSASTSWPANGEGPAAWADLGWDDAVYLIPTDPSRSGEFVSLELLLTATMTIEGIDDRGAVAGFAGATVYEHVDLKDTSPGTYVTSVTDVLTVRLGHWTTLRVEAWAQTRDAWNRTQAGTTAARVAVRALGFGAIRDDGEADVPIALLCTASGAAYVAD
jgi:hypothetical protein